MSRSAIGTVRRWCKAKSTTQRLLVMVCFSVPRLTKGTPRDTTSTPILLTRGSNLTIRLATTTTISPNVWEANEMLFQADFLPLIVSFMHFIFWRGFIFQTVCQLYYQTVRLQSRFYFKLKLCSVHKQTHQQD